MRCNGMPVLASFKNSGSAQYASVNGVLTHPGAIALVRTPVPDNSFAKYAISFVRLIFEMPYGPYSVSGPEAYKKMILSVFEL